MRLFIAYDFDKDSIEKLTFLQKNILKKFNNIRLTKSENIHLTIKFIGEYNNYENIVNNLKNSINFPHNFYLKSEIITGFPTIFNARVIVCKFQKNDMLIKIYNEIENRLSSLNIKKENRDFVPHITLARTNYPLKIEEIQYDNNEFKLNGLKLYKSTLTPKGPIYEILYEF